MLENFQNEPCTFFCLDAIPMANPKLKNIQDLCWDCFCWEGVMYNSCSLPSQASSEETEPLNGICQATACWVFYSTADAGSRFIYEETVIFIEHVQQGLDC